MPEITLQALQAKQTELAAMIAAYAIGETHTLELEAFAIELAADEHYAGAVLNEDGSLKHHLVLMADRPDDELAWADARTWATSVGGALPTRQEAALIFANCKPHVDGVWHWTSEEHESNASYAWYCYFDDGYQGYYDKSSAGAARAVRRLTP